MSRGASRGPTAAGFLSALDGRWRRCLELAWEAFSAGSIPVGSVLTDPGGHIVSEGRNRAFDDTAPTGRLRGTYLAHAEVNTLSALSPGDYPDHTLWSSLEPCYMCTVAVAHSHVGTVRFACVDPVMAGIGDLPRMNRWVRSRWPDRVGPVAGPLGDFAGLVHLVWSLAHHPDGVVAGAYATADPALLDLARRYHADGTLRTRRAWDVGDVIERCWADLLAFRAPQG